MYFFKIESYVVIKPNSELILRLSSGSPSGRGLGEISEGQGECLDPVEQYVISSPILICPVSPEYATTGPVCRKWRPVGGHTGAERDGRLLDQVSGSPILMIRIPLQSRQPLYSQNSHTTFVSRTALINENSRRVVLTLAKIINFGQIFKFVKVRHQHRPFMTICHFASM